MIVETFEQYSEEWWSGRRGLPTASQFGKIVTSSGNKSASWQAYAYKKAAEIITGKTEDTYKNENMDRGTELEPEARKAYEFIKDTSIEQVGMILKDDKSCLCSPDGVNLGFAMGVEIKCPIASTHLKYLNNGKIPTEYKPQVFGSLWICDDIETWDFMSYHPDMKPLIVTVDRSNEEYKVYTEAIEKILPDVSAFIKKVAESY